MTAPTCPHYGRRLVPDSWTVKWDCGEAGWLCYACREDRQDARTDRLVEGLALAGLLAASGATFDYRSGPCNAELAERTLVLAAALRIGREIEQEGS